MLPQEFIKKYSLPISNQEWSFCVKALRIMEESLDVNHDVSHVYRILDFLDAFLQTQEYQERFKSLDLKVFFLATIWHDTWKAQRDPKHIIALTWDTVWEGVGAARKFEKYAKKYQLDSRLIKKVRYIIKKHSLVQILPKRTLEPKLFYDLDTLDYFSYERLSGIEKKYLCDRPINAQTLALAKFAVKVFIINKTDKIFSTQWAKKQFHKKKAKFLKRVLTQINEYEKLLHLLKSGQKEAYKKYHDHLFHKYIKK